jgi:hypothetical protein
MHVIKKYHLLRKFRGRTASDLYVWIIKQWDDLKQKYGLSYSLDEATKTIAESRKMPLFSKLIGWCKKIFQT